MIKYIILIISLIIGYILSINGVKPVSNFMNNDELLPIVTANLWVDLAIIFIAMSGIIYTGKTLKLWYKKYRLSAVIADMFSIILGIILLRYIIYRLNIKVDLFQFILLGIGLCVIHDILFYLFFKSIPRGSNHMLDFFKDYSKDLGATAIIGDVILVIWAIILSSLLKNKSKKINIISLFIGIYLVPYIIYMKD
jgi:DMSO reductase anchor subunit